jgi:hypothetical protein
MRIAFIDAKSAVELFDPRVRILEERRRRIADARAVSNGKLSAAQLLDRNAMSMDDVDYELPELI